MRKWVVDKYTYDLEDDRSKVNHLAPIELERNMDVLKKAFEFKSFASDDHDELFGLYLAGLEFGILGLMSHIKVSKI